MSITKRNPNKIHLGDSHTNNGVLVNDLAASEAITPGHLVERFNDSGTIKLRKHSTAGGLAQHLVALDQNMLNRGYDTDYAIGDLVEALVCPAGESVWMLIPSGQNIAGGDRLESVGDGTLRILASGVALFEALENMDNTAGPSTARIRVEAL